MESSVDYLEQMVRKADTKLNDIVWRIELFEREVASEAINEKVSVTELMDSVMKIKDEYEKLKPEMLEIKEIQKYLRDSLYYKVRLVHEKRKALQLKMKGIPKEEKKQIPKKEMPKKETAKGIGLLKKEIPNKSYK